jgi:hypothetical protein
MADPIVKVGTGEATGFPRNLGVDMTKNTPRNYSYEDMKATELLQQKWETELRELSTLDDVLSKGMTLVRNSYSTDGIAIPDSIGMTITSGGQNTVHTFPVLDALGGHPLAGNASLQGKEKGQSMRFVKAYYNEEKDGVKVQTYGVAYNYENAFGMYEKATSQLTKYWAEVDGRQIRECLVQWLNREVVENNPYVTVSQHLNPNWVAPGTHGALAGVSDDMGMPIWNEDLPTFTHNVATTLIKSAEASGDVTTLRFFDKISYYAQMKLIQPLDDGTLICMVPMPVWYSLTGLGTEGGFGKHYTEVSAYPAGTNSYPGEMGRYRDLRIVPDTRWVGAVATEETAPAAGNASLTFDYLYPNNEDNRDKSVLDTDTDNFVFQLGFLLGKGAYIRRLEKDLHFKYDIQNYEQDKGIGTFREHGFNLNVIRTDAEAGNEYPDFVENRSSIVLAFPGVLF